MKCNIYEEQYGLALTSEHIWTHISYLHALDY